MTRYIRDKGFNKEFFFKIYTDHFSLIANPEKNKFYKNSITDDIWFLGSKFQEEKYYATGQTIVVPVPKKSRIMDSIAFFRDKYKFSAIVFDKLKSEGVLHELFRLTRIQAALVNSFFDADLRRLLLHLRTLSVLKLGLTENDIETNFDKLNVYGRDLDEAINKLSNKQDRIFCFYYWILNHTSAMVKNMARLWSPISIVSLYMQNVKPRKYRSDGGLQEEIKSYLKILHGKKMY